MSKRRTGPPIQDHARAAQEHARALAATLRQVESEGHAPTFQKVVGVVAKELGLSDGALSALLEGAEAKAEGVRRKLGEQLRDRAREVGCQFSFEPPNVTFGAVRLHEKGDHTGAWELSVLDAVVLETVQTNSAATLAAHALRWIEDIDRALQRRDAFVHELATAVELLRGSLGDAAELTPNLLMVVCGCGRGLRRQLITGEAEGPTTISRPQMGFLLRAAERLLAGKQSSKRLSFKAATQHVTKDPARFITVPEDIDPRLLAHEARPVAAVSLITPTERP